MTTTTATLHHHLQQPSHTITCCLNQTHHSHFQQQSLIQIKTLNKFPIKFTFNLSLTTTHIRSPFSTLKPLQIKLNLYQISPLETNPSWDCWSAAWPDYVVVDLEHGEGGFRSAPVSPTLAATGTASIIRTKAVSYCKFPPNGVRGSAHMVVRASNYEGVKKIEDIAKVDGVDCVQMGPLDLSASLGVF
ncbi:hypothetical protein MKW92_043717, partial [Papaver armeniacum]